MKVRGPQWSWTSREEVVLPARYEITAGDGDLYCLRKTLTPPGPSAAYEIASLGPEAKPAVPALIEALDDPDPTVRFPVTVALGEIGQDAVAAVPRLKQMMFEEINDEIAAGARRAIRHIQPSALAGQ